MNPRFNNFKMVLLGNYGVGKTSIVNRFINKPDLNTCSTIGAAFHTMRHYYDSKKYYNINIWDTAGQERYRSITQIYFNGVDIGLIVYDMTDIESLLEIEEYWIKDFYESRYLKDKKKSELVLFIVGNKSDMYYDDNGEPLDQNLHRGSQKILQRLQEKYPDILLFEVSAKTGLNSDKLKESLLIQLNKKFIAERDMIANKDVVSLNENKQKELYLGPLGTFKRPQVWCNIL